jgi:aspartate/glutamate racemase
MILCSSTSRRARLYDLCFPCTYPDLKTQEAVDGIILSILKGESSALRLSSLIERLEAEAIVLGCTELSLYSDQCAGSKQIIDPLGLLAKELIKKSFS